MPNNLNEDESMESKTNKEGLIVDFSKDPMWGES